MAISNPELLLKSRAIPVLWGGWESTTVELCRSGWDIAVSVDHRCARYQFLFRHAHMKLGAWAELYDLGRHPREWMEPGHAQDIMPIRMNMVAPAAMFNLHVQGEMNFKWVDAEPELVSSTIVTMDDLSIFKLQAPEVPSVYVDQADMSVVDHLQEILDSQAGKQRELREKATRDTEDFADRETSRIIQQIIKVG